MKTIKNSLLTAVGVVALTGCGTFPGEQTTVEIPGPTVISFDHGATDTLVELGLADKILAVPKTGLPEYLSDLADGRADAGNLKTPDLDVVADIDPDLVLVTGRQGESQEALEAITQVQNVSLLGDNYREAVGIRVLGLGTLYGRYNEANAGLQALWDYVEQARAGISSSPSVAVVTHNDGNFSLRDEAVVSQLLGLESPPVPAGVESFTRGTRVFTPVTPTVLAEMAPQHLFVVDRSAAIGAGHLDEEGFRNALTAAGGEGIRVTVLDPQLWYLSGGGLQSVRLQVDEIVDAL